MDKATYIVTGATGGIGRAIVEGLIARGVPRIVMACRSMDRAGELIARLDGRSTDLVAMRLDLESFA